MTEQAPSENNPFARIFRLLPILLIAAIVMGNGLLCITAIIPAWRTHEQLSSQIGASSTQLSQQSAQGGDASVLQHQIDSYQGTLEGSAGTFLTQSQADGMIDALYRYAQTSGVEITNIQSQQAAPDKGKKGATAEAPVYDVHVFRLQAAGTMSQLMNFVTLIREAALPSVTITNVSIKKDQGTPHLTMDLLLYTSPYATGKAFDNLPTSVPQLTVTPQAAATLPVTVTAEAAVPTPLPTEPPLALIFTDGFDKGELYAWNLGPGWSLVNEDGSKALSITTSTAPLTFFNKALTDSAVQLRFKLDNARARLSLRESDKGSYTVTFDATGQFTLYRANSPVQSAHTADLGTGWHTLRLSAVHGMIRVSVDDVEIITAIEDGTLPPGTFSLSLLEGGTLWIDDVKVWTLNGAK